jgi:putative nucleotidyltransferase with HDIG domain
LLRAGILLAPLVGSSIVLLVVSHLWRAPANARNLWLAAMAVIAVLVAIGIERLARRLLPLASLLRLTMLFPDQAPSRIRMARAAGTTGDYLDRMARSDDDTAQVAAEKVLTLITALGNHDRKTRGHSERVRLYCDLLAEELRLSRPDRDRLRWGALLHDIGKLEIAPKILNKPAKLSDREFARIREHPSVGAEIASPLLPWLGDWGRGIIDHHERWDGRGYPEGLAGTEISQAGRIVGVVDSFETMTAARVYKKAMTTRAARIELADCAGSQFDPECVRAFLSISLPRVLWAMGPLAFIVQLPFLRSLARLGSQATQLPLQGASTVSVAAAASVFGVVSAPSVISAHTHWHSHPHSHSSGTVAGSSNGHAAANLGGTNGSSGSSISGGSGAVTEPVADNHVGSQPGTVPPPVAHRVGGVPLPAPSPSPAGGTTPTPTPGGGSGGSGPTPLSLAPITTYVVQNTSAAVDALLQDTANLTASTLQVVSAPSNGTATVNSDGTINYQPARGFHGVDQVVYDVCNAAGQCGSATVTINVLAPGQSGADYSGVNFAGLDLQGFDFANATLRGTNFTGANLTNVNFGNADLSGANLSSATVANTNVNGADLSGADLSGVSGGSGPQFAAVNLTATIGQPVTINLANIVSDADAPIDWSTLAITKQPAHGSARVTGPHSILFTPAAGLVSVVQVTVSVANVLTFSGSSQLQIAVVL